MNPFWYTYFTSTEIGHFSCANTSSLALSHSLHCFVIQPCETLSLLCCYFFPPRSLLQKDWRFLIGILILFFICIPSVSDSHLVFGLWLFVSRDSLICVSALNFSPDLIHSTAGIVSSLEMSYAALWPRPCWSLFCSPFLSFLLLGLQLLDASRILSSSLLISRNHCY